MLCYNTLNEHYRRRFGCKVYKLSLDGGFTCPNRDGTKGVGGCVFCSDGSGSFAEKISDGGIEKALERAKQRVEGKNRSGKYIAYFQSFSSTYEKTERLRELFEQALAPDYIVGLAVATRPDCLPDKTVEMLGRLARRKPISVELGLQTVNGDSIKYIGRGFENEEYFSAVRRLHAVGVEVVTHIILGLPRETADDAVATTRAAVLAGTDGVKFHTLHVLKGTRLADDYKRGMFDCMTLEEYAEALRLCIKELPDSTVVHRITGDGAKRDLIAPLWTADKKRTLNFLYKYLEES